MNTSLEHLDPLENSILLLGESLQYVVNEQQYLLTRERLSRESKLLFLNSDLV